MTSRTERLHLTGDDQIAQRYHEVPVDVTGGSSLEVEISYDTHRAVVDLGCEGPGGWRGWSGAARRRFVITAGAATPGYLPGELEAGRWTVVLGLHKVPAEGIEVNVQIRSPAVTEPEPEPVAGPVPGPARGSTRPLPAPAGMRWYAGDFHAHTLHSDGSESISQLAARGVGAGLDFVAVTDHNTVSHHPHLPGVSAAHGITLLPGQEVTTSRGHANAFGDIGWVDFREPASRWVEEVAARGGVLSVNHPIEGDCAWLHPLGQLPRAMELWHISWFRDLAATDAWAFWRRWGHDVVPIGGSDFHAPGRGWTLGTPTTWVAAEDCSPEAVLDGVQQGRTAISVGVRPDATPDPLHTPVLLRLDDELHAIDAEGAVLVDLEGRRRRITGAHQRVPSSWGLGPFHLQDADRRLLAVC